MKILITDGNCRSSLALTRSLGKKGIKVIVCEEFAENLAASSRFCYKKCTYPSPSFLQREFLQRIHQIVEEESIDLIIPMTDVTMDIMLSNYSEFEKNMLRALPTTTSYYQVTDKINLLKYSAELGINIPESIFIESRSELLEVLQDINYPVIVKPARSKLNVNGKIISTSVSYAESKEKLLQLYEQNDHLKKPFIIQKIIQGHGMGIFALYNQGSPVRYFCHKRLRERPPSGGVSAISESVPLDSELKVIAEKLLKAVSWHGIAMVEFKVEKNTGVPYLMEINGRFWGSLQLAIDSGIDFPYLLYQLSTNRAVTANFHYQTGRKSRWFLGDLDHLYFRLLKKEGNEGLPSDFYSKLEAIYIFLKYNGKDCKFDVFRFSDLKPFFVELNQYVNRARM